MILINGLPGTGKTTLVSRLSPDLGIPCMGKDQLKEFFFDTLGSDGREQSRLLGRAASQMLYILASEYLAAGQPLMVESAFFVEFARPEFKKVLDAHPAHVIEVYCFTEAMVRRERFQRRNESGERHQGHIDGTDLTHLRDDDPEPLETYAPLELGKVIRVDTTRFDDQGYEQLLAELKQELV